MNTHAPILTMRRQGRVAVLTMDNPPVNAIGEPLRVALIREVAAAMEVERMHACQGTLVRPSPLLRPLVADGRGFSEPRGSRRTGSPPSAGR